MPLDFGLLSMTELRTRPGEILDRVANNGEAFVIESNSRRKACLVPLSFFFPDVSPARISAEMQELADRGEEPRTTFTVGRELAFRFDANLDDNTTVEILILLPHGYPSSCPKVYANPISEEAPHRWADGALCLYGVMTGWNPGKHTVLTTLNLTRQWLKHYDTWLKCHEWPTPENLIYE